jgi:cbb3-type cytochrome oxidase subunit 3
MSRSAYTGYMYGYEPRKSESEEGGWRETLTIVWVAFRVIMPVMGLIAAVMGAVALTLVLGTIDSRLVLLPVGAAVAALVWFLRREKRQQADEEARIFGPSKRS